MFEVVFLLFLSSSNCPRLAVMIPALASFWRGGLVDMSCYLLMIFFSYLVCDLISFHFYVISQYLFWLISRASFQLCTEYVLG